MKMPKYICFQVKTDALELIDYSRIVENERERGLWITDGNGTHCSRCGAPAVKEYVDSMSMRWREYHSKYCPACGCLMTEDEV